MRTLRGGNRSRSAGACNHHSCAQLRRRKTGILRENDLSRAAILHSEFPSMTRYYFYTADLYLYDEPENPVGKRVGDYQGVYSIDDDSMTPDQVFTNLLEELKKTIPAEIKDTGYYHVTQFNNVT
jgi:hypothetical protein